MTVVDPRVVEALLAGPGPDLSKLDDDQPTLDWLLGHPERWRVYVSGYALGFLDGIARGRAQVEAEDVARGEQVRELLRRRRNAVPYAELQRRRSTCLTPALTAEQIRTQAASSWGEVRGGRVSA